MPDTPAPQGTRRGSSLRVIVPDWYRDPEFTNWLRTQSGKGLATWLHADLPEFDPAPGGELAAELEYADVFVCVEPVERDGTWQDMPERFWNALVDIVLRNGPWPPHEMVVVWLSAV